MNGFVVNQTRHITCGQNSTYGQLPISAKTSDACLVEGVISHQSVVLIYWLVAKRALFIHNKSMFQDWGLFTF